MNIRRYKTMRVFWYYAGKVPKITRYESNTGKIRINFGWWDFEWFLLMFFVLFYIPNFKKIETYFPCKNF